jgi:hypothetical protein
MLVGAAKEVSAGAADHQCCRILTAIRQSRIARAALLGLVRSISAAVRREGLCILPGERQRRVVTDARTGLFRSEYHRLPRRSSPLLSTPSLLSRLQLVRIRLAPCASGWLDPAVDPDSGQAPRCALVARCYVSRGPARETWVERRAGQTSSAPRAMQSRESASLQAGRAKAGSRRRAQDAPSGSRAGARRATIEALPGSLVEAIVDGGGLTRGVSFGGRVSGSIRG